jgi:hypothetical protein
VFDSACGQRVMRVGEFEEISLEIGAKAFGLPTI